MVKLSRKQLAGVFAGIAGLGLLVSDIYPLLRGSQTLVDSLPTITDTSFRLGRDFKAMAQCEVSASHSARVECLVPLVATMETPAGLLSLSVDLAQLHREQPTPAAAAAVDAAFARYPALDKRAREQSQRYSAALDQMRESVIFRLSNSVSSSTYSSDPLATNNWMWDAMKDMQYMVHAPEVHARLNNPQLQLAR